NFQNERGLFANSAGVIGESCFVGGSDFAQFRTGRFEEFADPKTAADLDELAAGNNNFLFLVREMVSDQHERGGAVVHDGGRFGLAKDGERAFQIGAANSAISGREIELYIIISRCA